MLPHENVALHRQLAGPVRYEPADRLWFAALSGLIPRRRRARVLPITPATLWTLLTGVAAGQDGEARAAELPPYRCHLGDMPSARSQARPLWFGSSRSGSSTPLVFNGSLKSCLLSHVQRAAVVALTVFGKTVGMQRSRVP